MKRTWLVLAVVLGCSSSATAPEEYTEPQLPAVAANPEGVPYPTDSIGVVARRTGRKGDRIPNFTFSGYPASDRASGLKTIALANYYDPKASHHRILHLIGVASWCPICRGEAEDLKKVQAELPARGVVTLMVMLNGNTNGYGPSVDEVGTWMTRYDTRFDFGIDVRARKLGTMGVNGVPWNVLVDTRTMEILFAGAGAPSDVLSFVDAGLDVVKKIPPSYPLPE